MQAARPAGLAPPSGCGSCAVLLLDAHSPSRSTTAVSLQRSWRSAKNFVMARRKLASQTEPRPCRAEQSNVCLYARGPCRDRPDRVRGRLALALPGCARRGVAASSVRPPVRPFVRSTALARATFARSSTVRVSCGYTKFTLVSMLPPDFGPGRAFDPDPNLDFVLR